MSSHFPTTLIEKTANLLANLPTRGKTRLISIDGRGGSGKTTFAKQLAALIKDAQVICMDHFLIPTFSKQKDNSNYIDWQRLKTQVITPLLNGKVATFQKYDWHSDSLLEKRVTAYPGKTTIIEGVFSQSQELIHLYDYKIWIECPQQISLKRAITRDGESSLQFWTKVWLPEENKYINLEKPYEKADLVIIS